MHIGVDGHLLCKNRTGMGVVVYSILKYWVADNNIKITVFVPEILENDLYDILVRNNIQIKVCRKSNYFIWEQIILPKEVKVENIDVLWCPYNTAPLIVKCATVITVHDLIYMSLLVKNVPSLYKKMGLIYRRTIVPLAIKRANRIITISQYTKKQIASRFSSVQDKIEIVYNSTDINTEELGEIEKQQFFDKYRINYPYILGFGSLEYRKNSLGLLKAYNKLPVEIKKRYQLVLFGFRGFEESEDYRYIHENKIDNVVVLGYISEKEKTTLYRNSKVFVFPTFSEGFGIPVLEAFSNKTAVITSNVTSLPEVAGNAALFVNPNELDDINKAMVSVLSNETMRLDLIEKGQHQLNSFDWETSSTMVLRILQEVVQYE